MGLFEITVRQGRLVLCLIQRPVYSTNLRALNVAVAVAAPNWCLSAVALRNRRVLRRAAQNKSNTLSDLKRWTACRRIA